MCPLRYIILITSIVLTISISFNCCKKKPRKTDKDF